jgi:polyadenylate-binding protein 2
VQLQELDEMKRRLKEMEEEAAALRDMQAKVAKEMQGCLLMCSPTLPFRCLVLYAVRLGFIRAV